MYRSGGASTSSSSRSLDRSPARACRYCPRALPDQGIRPSPPTAFPALRSGCRSPADRVQPGHRPRQDPRRRARSRPRHSRRPISCSTRCPGSDRTARVRRCRRSRRPSSSRHPRRRCRHHLPSSSCYSRHWSPEPPRTPPRKSDRICSSFRYLPILEPRVSNQLL